VLKCGGGKALTKQASDEAALKCHVTMEEAVKMVESTTKIMDNRALVICGARVNPQQESKPILIPVKIRLGSLRSRLGKIMQRLYDLESGNEPEEPLRVNLEVDLYQMEDF
jgi:hypothetical protein